MVSNMLMGYSMNVAMTGSPEKSRNVSPEMETEVVHRQDADPSNPSLVNDPECACSLESLQARADAVTPILAEILRFVPPQRWEIN